MTLQDTGSIAIVAVAGRFPGARDVDAFWRNLRAGVESIRHYTPAELDALGVGREVRAHPKFVPAGALLEDVERFDASLFGFGRRDAEVLDPQHRLFFECVWEALERAGYAPGLVREPVGLFAGTSLSTYLLYNLIPDGQAIRDVGLHQIYIANDKDSLTTHVAYKLNLKGPSVTVQTACSTSLVAVQFACQSLLSFQCDIAVAGGVSVQVPLQPGYVYQEGGIASPDGHCRAFDAAAAGTVSGNGVGAVVLKRLEDALAARDTIVAVIRGAAINNDGAAKIGYTAPSVDGQAEVVALAQGLAGIAPDSIGYIEAHGTGTPLGDPVELAALTRVFTAQTRRRQFCAIGSVKTNIGHLDAAAGVAGLIKAALAVQHGIVPPSLHFDHANPNARLDEGPFFVPTAAIPWPLTDGPRRAGVSSFGIGGTNAHVVLEEAPEPPATGPSRAAQLLMLSARSADSVDRLVSETAAQLSSRDDLTLADAAFTLHTGRRAWLHRRVVVAATKADAVSALNAGDARLLRGEAPARPPAVAFLFPGQGTQFAGMARELYDSEAIFRAELDACCDGLRPHLGLDLRPLLLTNAASAEAGAQLKQTALAQPALFAIEYALARLWHAWGVRPDAMIGHSLGEFVAACVAGVFSLADALALIAARGRLMQALPPGAMLAIALSEAELAPLLGAGVSLAAVNGPQSVVASGPFDEIDRLAALLDTKKVTHRRLETSHAFHSAMMEPMLDAFSTELARVRFSPPSLAYVSNVTGTWIAAGAATDPAYWLRHLREPVRFADGLATLLGDGTRVALEVGPGRTLSNLARALPRTPHPAPRTSGVSVPAPRTSPVSVPSLPVAEAVAQLWLAGVDIDWHAYYAGEQRRRVPMPVTPFERQRYWIDPPGQSSRIVAPAQTAAASRIDDWFYVPHWSPAPLREANGVEPRTIAVVGGAPPLVERLVTRLKHDGHNVSAVTMDGLATLVSRRAAGDAAPIVCDVGSMTGTRHDAFDVPLTIARTLATVSSATLLLIADASPIGALATGPALVIPQEYPHISTRLIVVDPKGDAVDAIAREINATEPLVAIRDGVRMTRRFTRVVSGANGPAKAGHYIGPLDHRLKHGGVYWITGASGGIGRALADHLARTYGARLLLTSRTVMSPDAIAALEAAGSDVLVVAGDVSDRAAMDAAATAAVARFGRIDGIIHTAGVAGGGVIALKSLDAAAATVFASKVDGTLVLAELARRHAVGFLALCSSLASLQGGFGQSDYVAANAFLDAFAESHTRASGIFTVAINWDAWRETGMAVAVASALHARAGGAHAGASPITLPHGLLTRDGIAAFERILDGNATQVAVSIADLDTRITALRDGTKTMTAMAGGGSRGLDTGSALSVDAELAAIWRGVLGDDAASHDSFFDVGGDSLKGVQLVARINERFALDIPVARFFGAPTLASLAALIRESAAPAVDPSGDPSGDHVLDPSRERGRRRSERRRGRVSA